MAKFTVYLFLVLNFIKCLVSTSNYYGGKYIIKSGGLTQFERQQILDSHNRLRQSVALGQVQRQPPAANMMEIQWDDELAARAQYWSDQTIIDHDDASQRNVGRFAVGQNLAATWTTRPVSSREDYAPDFLSQIKAWFDEVSIYGFRPADYDHETGHYSQLVWGETSLVGCGFTLYYDWSRGYTKLYVCNYGPGGNVIGTIPYKQGYPACGSYGLANSGRYNGLCAPSYASAYNSNYNTYQYGGAQGAYNPQLANNQRYYASSHRNYPGNNDVISYEYIS